MPSTGAGWQSGHAEDCKSSYVGSIPAPASISRHGLGVRVQRLARVLRPEIDPRRRALPDWYRVAARSLNGIADATSAIPR